MFNMWCLVVLCFSFSSALDFKKEQPPKRVCVIGAGIAGLSSARYLKEEGINFTVYEVTRYVGGTWRYDPRTGTDEYGIHLHTSMYKNLRTNLPKPTMELRGFPLPDDAQSFPSWEIYYKYLQAFTKHFDIEQHIKFLHNVVLVRRENNVWKVKLEHVITGETFGEEFDYIIVGNGHFSKPNMPSVTGEDIFRGSIIHSHDYRKPDPYRNRSVLIVGAGPSGMDIAIDVARIARRLVHSHHSPANFKTVFPPHYARKTDVKELKENGAVFIDGSFEEVDDIIYCTGFQYDYPFLDETSELAITHNTVIPLYKYMVNIKQPTMIILGLVVRACLVIALDAQARYATAVVKGNFTLPSQEEMMQDWQRHVNVLTSKGLPLKFIHHLAHEEDEYYASLSEESGIDRVPPVMFKIRAVDIQAKLDDLYTYRNYVYTVVDDNTFTKTLEESPTSSSLTP